MVAGVAGADGRVLETQEGLVFGRGYGLEVSQDLVAESGALNVGAEPSQLVAARAPARDEIFPVHRASPATPVWRARKARPQMTSPESVRLPGGSFESARCVSSRPSLSSD